MTILSRTSESKRVLWVELGFLGACLDASGAGLALPIGAGPLAIGAGIGFTDG